MDGEADTYWRSARGEPQWLEVDLQAACAISGVRIEQPARASESAASDRAGNRQFGTEILSSFAAAYVVQVSDDQLAWRTVATVTQGKGGMETTLFETVTARFVRVVINRRSADFGVGISTLSVLGTCATSRPAPVGWRWRGVRAMAEATPTEAYGYDALLDRGWMLARENWVAGDGAMVSSAACDLSAWLPAVVPGTVLAALVADGVFPEPTIGLNNLRIPEALNRRSWWYRIVFQTTGVNRGDQRRWLEFDGINHCAEVWLNGTQIGTIAGAFTRARFDVTEHLEGSGTNILAVRLLPPPHPGVPLEKSETTSIFNGGQQGKDSPAMLATVGWDWMPGVRDRGMGIWQGVRLHTVDRRIRIGDVQVATTGLADDLSTADLTVRVPVTNHYDGSSEVRCVIAIPGLVQPLAQTMTLAGGETRLFVFSPANEPNLRIAHPRLWWPNGYGDQPLFEMQATCQEVKGNVKVPTGMERSCDKSRTSFGIRQLTYDTQTDLHGGAITFTPVPARWVRLRCLEPATNQGFALRSFVVNDTHRRGATDDRVMDLALNHAVVASSSALKYPADLAVDGDATTRWTTEGDGPQWLSVDLGSEQTVDQVRFDWDAGYAKRYAIDVSQDGTTWTTVHEQSDADRQLVIRCNGRRIWCVGGNWGYDEMLKRMPPERMEAAVRLHRAMGFTMIRNWIGMTMTEDFFAACDRNGILVWNDFWLANPVDGPDPDDEAMFLANAADAITRFRNHPSLALWCGRNEGMPTPTLDKQLRRLVDERDGTRLYQPHSADRGVCGNGPYGWQPPAKYVELAQGFKSELGMMVVPTAVTMRTALGDEQAWPVGPAWAYHDFCVKGAMRADAYRSALETRYGAAKDLDDFCRKAQLINYEGLRAMFEGWNGKLFSPCSGLLLWMSHPAWYSTVWQLYAYDLDPTGAFDGAHKACEPVHVQMSAATGRIQIINRGPAVLDGATVLAEVRDLAGDVRWHRRIAVDAAQDRVTETLFVPRAEEFPAVHLVRLVLSDRQGTELSRNDYWRATQDADLAQLTGLKSGEPGITITALPEGAWNVVVSNPGPAPLAMARLVLRDPATDARILPVFWSDNMITLLPGERRTLTVTAARPAGGQMPRVTVEIVGRK